MNKLALGAFALSLTVSSFTFAEEQKISFESKELAKGLYMIQGVGGFAGGNIALSVGDDGVIMIDDSMPPLLDTLNAKIKEVAGAPVDFLINTHVHGDHTGNNAAFGAGATHIVAHENMRKRMLEKGVQGQNGMVDAPKDALPVITFTHHMNFHLNDQPAHLFHVGRAHTDGDTVIHFTSANVIHTGDAFFNGMFPFIDLNSGGTVAGYIAAQKRIYGMCNATTKLIPGHGPLANREDLKASIDMLEDARKIMLGLIKQGLSEEDVVAKNPLKKYHDKWNWGFITTEKMTRTLYTSLSKKKTDDGHNHHSHGGHNHSEHNHNENSHGGHH